MPLYDLTQPLDAATPVYPGDPPLRLEPWSSLDKGDRCTVRRLSMGSHTGTHVDAPAHVLPGGAPLEQIPLDRWLGPALLVDYGQLEGLDLTGVRRLLLAGCGGGLPLAAAQRVAASDVQLLGIDGSSADAPDHHALPVHQLLLGAGVVLVENLRLAGAPRGTGHLSCLPLLLHDADGAPCRVLWQPSTPSCGAPA